MKIKYAEILGEIEPIISSDNSLSEILAAITRLLKNKIYHYDWVGFYILDKDNAVLKLGPFSGKPTEHTTIAVGQGVCGQVAETMKLKVVQDVSTEGNYIACSLEVQSEIVVPILVNGQFVAEIDIDSHSPAPFTPEDEHFLTALSKKLATRF